MSTLLDFYDPFLYELNVGHAPRVGDVYCKELSSLPPGSRVLDLGCGTGDILVPLAVEGAEVIGVDSSPRMLEHLARRLATLPDEVAARVRLVERTVPALPAMDRADGAVLANDFVSHLLSDTELDELFRNVRRVLKPGAILLLDVERFDVAFLGSLTGSGGGLTRTHGFFDYPDGRLLRVDEQSVYDEASGVITSTFGYQILDGQGMVESTTYRTLRMCPRRIREITVALQLAGFDITEVRADAFPAELDHILISARARAEHD
ncbi:class I SAM-dependent methyltransferase [Nonomuraea longispora]|uniref:Class I SAM-dependent methyltransferase n=1 Tax=Nonomuraea longispora TaxID=1848320 RepID=A0A4R4NDU7_9ACTN|nr:class I SAM-dependent methyltransferase [Nonomuraea longispora]TDC05347.1 class I SAM-dependent methyltransferase [Nonomuraea longispora]